MTPGDRDAALPAAAVTDALASAAGYAAAEKSEATRKVYRSDLKQFVAWCGSVGRRALPAEAGTCAAFLAVLADRGYKAATIARKAAALAYAHRLAGEASPLDLEATKAVLRGVRRTIGTAQACKRPMTADVIGAAVRKLPKTIAGKRDRALLLLGFAAALRRSEIVALEMRDIERTPEGVLLQIRRSKTDQEGAGRKVAVPADGKLKVVDALDAWLVAADIRDGFVFRRLWKDGRVGGSLSGESVALIVKRAAERGGFDAAGFSGHSLRAGFVTSALANGADIFRVMDQTGHREVKTLKTYDRRAKAFKDHPGRKFL